MVPPPCIALELIGDSVLLWPRETHIERISSLYEHQTCVRRDEGGRIVCHDAGEEDGNEEDLMAIFRESLSPAPSLHNLTLAIVKDTGGMTCAMEPFVDGAFVEPLVSSSPRQSAKGVTIPRSGEAGRTYIYLRNGDTIDFKGESLKIKVTIDDDPHVSESQVAFAHMANGIELKRGSDMEAEVQVKSSNAEARPAGEANTTETNGSTFQDDNDDEADDDLDRPPYSARTSQHYTAPEEPLGTPTPASATIKETPNHQRVGIAVHTTDDEQPYSTARPHPDDSAGASGPTGSGNDTNSDPSSPSLHARKAKIVESVLDSVQDEGIVSHESEVEEESTTVHLNTKTQMDEDGQLVLDNMQDDGMDANDSEGDLQAIPTRRIGTTYTGKQTKSPKSRSTPHHSSPDEQEPHIIDDETTDHESDVTPNDEPMRSTVPDSTISEEAPTAVKRLVSRKRKLDTETEPPLLDESTPEEKKAKIDTSDEDASTILRSAARRSTMGKPPSHTPRLSTQDTGEEIVVAASRTSPKVVIAKKETRHDTPSSSTSSLIGKTPKVLLSSESTVLSSKELKKWLTKMSVNIIDTVPSKRTHFVCVVPRDHSLRSAKVLHSLAMNKLVVTDDWLTASKEEGEVLAPESFLHATLSSARHVKRDAVFAGKRLYFTDLLVANYKKTGWENIKDVAREAGTLEVDKVASDRPGRLKADNVFFFGADDGDDDVSRLISDGYKVYSKELFTRSIIEGQLRPGKEDELSATTASTTKKRNRRS